MKQTLSDPLFLGADLGGTKTLLALAQFQDEKFTILAKTRFESQQYATFEEILSTFLNAHLQPSQFLTAAAFSIAGPIEKEAGHQLGKLTHLPWRIDDHDLSARFKITQIALINDIAAFGYGIDHLPPNSFETLHTGYSDPNGGRLIAGLGTGFNTAFSCPDGSILSAESGHASLSLHNEKQLSLGRFLLQELGDLNRERVLSGHGLTLLLQFFRQQSALKPGSDFLLALEQSDDPASIIGKTAVAGTDPVAVAVLRLYVEILAEQLANLALQTLPTKGIFLAGGIPPKILPFLQEKSFWDNFRNHEPMQRLLDKMPIHVILNDQAALIGALAQAAAAITRQSR